MKKPAPPKKILVVGFPERQAEFAQLNITNADLEFAEEFDFSVHAEMLELEEDFYGQEEEEFELPDLEDYDVVIDLNLDEFPDNLAVYAEYPDLVIVGCAVRLSLGMMLVGLGEEMENPVFGMNALPTFINRPVMEMSLRNGRDFDALADLMDDLGLKFEIVEDRVGMVTPRVVTMVINEAAFTYGEGTAGIEEIDQAMKLGTNYPYGPFEWADKIGIEYVMGVLTSMQVDAFDSRYKIAPALRAALLNGTKFYS